MTGAIDLAFIDRADVKQFLDFPSIKAIYKIYYSCIQELLRVFNLLLFLLLSLKVFLVGRID